MLTTPFKIVLGSHAVTPVPVAARAFGLRHRFALVQSTHHPDSPGMVIDPTALLVVLRALDQRSESLGTLFWDAGRRQKITRLELEPHYRSRRVDQYLHVAAGEWRHGIDPTVLLETETWDAVGGPAPYHDSLTYSFYSAEDLSARLLAALRHAGLVPAEVVCAPLENAAASAHPPRRWPQRVCLGVFFLTLFVAGLCFGGEFSVAGIFPPQIARNLGAWCATSVVVVAVLAAAGFALARRYSKGNPP